MDSSTEKVITRRDVSFNEFDFRFSSRNSDASWSSSEMSFDYEEESAEVEPVPETSTKVI